MSISVPEMLKILLEANTPVKDLAKGGVMVGPPSPSEMNEGVVSLAPTGLVKNERDLPLTHVSAGVRCVAPSGAEAEALATKVNEALHETRREVVEQPSNGESYLIHSISVSGGPSLAAGPTEDFWEVNQTVDVMAGTEAVE